ncbi:delta-endotoxin CytB [Schizophyllum fasciatum]
MAAPNASNENATYFQPLYKIPDALVDTANEVNKFASAFVKPDWGHKDFGWVPFRKAVDSYPGNNLISGNFREASVAFEEKLDYMIESLPSLVANFPHGVSGQDVKDAARAAFTDLQTAKTNGWADFHSQTSSSTSTWWEYRVLLAGPSQDLKDAVSAVVTTIHLIADIEDESDWYSITGDTVHNYYISPVTILLIAKKGFVSPDTD